MEDTKPAVASKINWAALTSVIGTATSIPMFNDPNVVAAIANVETFIPAQWLPWLVIGSNIAIMVIRTFFTKTKIAGVVTQQ